MNEPVHMGKHFLVVGASSGIGAAIARTLAREGASISLIARREDKLQEVEASLDGSGHSSHVFDVTKHGEIRGLLENIITQGGTLDGMVYCAAVADSCRLRDLTPARIHDSMQANFYPFLEFVRSIVALKQRDASLHVVVLSSLASISNDKYYTLYSAPKAAIDAAVRCLSTELAKRKVTINSIQPAVVNVERVRDMFEMAGNIDEQIKKSGYQPLGMIPAEEIAQFASFLLSPYSAHITGANLPYNGGAR